MAVCTCAMVDRLIAITPFISRHAVTIEVSICINALPMATVYIGAIIYFVVTEKPVITKVTVTRGSVREGCALATLAWVRFTEIQKKCFTILAGIRLVTSACVIVLSSRSTFPVLTRLGMALSNEIATGFSAHEFWTITVKIID